MKTIHCSECKTLLGEIRDATLKKNMAFLCPTCESARTLSRPAKTDIPDFFKGIFK
jgi:phage FluMu protein Com